MQHFISPISRLLKIPLLLLLLVAALIFAWRKFNAGDFSGWFKSKPLLIENTPVVITQIQNIAELQTAKLYAEIVTDSTIITGLGTANEALGRIGMASLPVDFNRKLVLITKGTVIAGINLKDLNEQQVFIKDDSISITLPAPRYLDVISNPSDFEIFLEQGSWTDAEVQAVKAKARRQLLQKANEQQLLQRAATQSATAIEQMMRSFGFTKIHISTGKP